MLSVGQLTRITVELMLGAPPSNTSPEALEARAVKALDLAEMRKQGLTPLLLDDFDVDLPPLPSTPAPTDEEKRLSKRNAIRSNLGKSWELARRLEAEERDSR